MKARYFYIDNLRWVMILLVVSMHAAVTYSHLGSWYYMEDRPVGAVETGIFATYQVTLQSFFMGFLFFLAGFFVPAAYDKKGPGRFLRDRAFRLGLPLLLYMFVLQPVAVFCITLFHGERIFPDGFFSWYGRYLTHGRWLGGTGPLWFCEALLLFCVAYAGIRAVRGRAVAVPGTPTRPRVWLFIALIAVCTFLVRFPWPNGTSFYNLQFCYFSQYIFFFAAGTLAYRGDWLSRIPVRDGKFWGRVALVGLIVVWPLLIVAGGTDFHVYAGGAHWQSLAMAFWETTMGVSISLYLVTLFRERWDGQGPVAQFFSKNAFAVYVFHAPVLIALSRWMSPAGWPLLVMFLCLTLLSILVTFALSSLALRRLPVLKRIL
ncbi:acyltransferase family protein [Dinghuibacter silviterrae]|uniref:Fucose 4-O-acetylase-like acetyltransferase n=1 Tax=Dinghuibacter silviterrae TaxID=1539049 RepID=A0A4R8DUK5_9BACT|nr:acyltransferase family protein [Dinghuibacter silviterrae]TDX02054.1 fucose 4-O-acetylase-like acetyltransferase [Dinghuibacter silviterrae]